MGMESGGGVVGVLEYKTSEEILFYFQQTKRYSSLLFLTQNLFLSIWNLTPKKWELIIKVECVIITYRGTL